MRTLILLAVFSMSFFACNNTTKSPEAKVDKTQKEVETVKSTPPTESTKKYKLTPFENSYEYTDADLKLTRYSKGRFNFTVSSEDYKLGTETPDADSRLCANSSKGQHIHLIIDNAPYAAKYVAQFEHDVKDGEHYMLSFLSRSYHESIKTPSSFVAQKVNVRDKTITNSEDIKEPMLFYSRPKGTYVGKDTEKIMLDFFLLNAKMSANGYKVKASINGEDHLLTNWKPYFVEGLPMGENTIELTLLDASGNVADVPLNPVKRVFQLQKETPK